MITSNLTILKYDMITLRKYNAEDCDSVSKLFYETIHCINAKDYTEAQLSAWAKDCDALKSRQNDLLEQVAIVAEIDGITVGFGSINKTGYLDLLYVHKSFQRQGIATALCDELELGFSVVTTHASVTAKPFFEKRGYIVIKSQQVERFGVKLKNYVMQKTV